MAIEKQKLVEMLETMLRIRIFEERVAKEYSVGKIPGIIHLYLGEEAVATGACANLNSDDYIVSTHRGHGHLIAKGGKTDKVMAEIYGKSTGYGKGKGGSMHVADTDLGMLGANGIVGAGIPVATGAALAAQIRGTRQVAVSFFGEGATNTGRFHEGINLGSARHLPIVYIVENNLWMVSTRTSTVMNIPDIADRATAYGIPGISIDGNDVIAVFETVGEAVERARNGEGPTLVVCNTYRWHGHMEGDPQLYKPKEEIEEWMKKDPIPRYEKYLVENGVMTEEEIKGLTQEMIEEIDKATAFAEESPLPSPEEVLKDVFA
ncbi:thiamine pyrophosphate-dependent dehydrogenase E1 component subunit alpha [Chloroflexota bacterium]